MSDGTWTWGGPDPLRLGWVLEVEGEVDESNVDALEAEVGVHLLAGLRTLTVDCARLRFAGSAFLRVLVAAHRHGCTVTIRNPTPQVRRLLDVTELTALFAVEP